MVLFFAIDKGKVSLQSLRASYPGRRTSLFGFGLRFYRLNVYLVWLFLRVQL